MPSDKIQTAFRIEPEILEALQEIKDRDGVPVSEQVRRALRTWIEAKSATKKDAAPRRAAANRKG
jgi:hypothetical protein